MATENSATTADEQAMIAKDESPTTTVIEQAMSAATTVNDLARTIEGKLEHETQVAAPTHQKQERWCDTDDNDGDPSEWSTRAPSDENEENRTCVQESCTLAT